jgi:hypothetical protein
MPKKMDVFRQMAFTTGDDLSIAKNNILQEILLVISEKQMILHTEIYFR